MTLPHLASFNGRAECILEIARQIQSGSLKLTASTSHDIIENMTSIPGIGPWTANYVAMRVIHWPDAFPKEGYCTQEKAGWDLSEGSRGGVSEMAALEELRGDVCVEDVSLLFVWPQKGGKKGLLNRGRAWTLPALNPIFVRES